MTAFNEIKDYYWQEKKVLEFSRTLGQILRIVALLLVFGVTFLKLLQGEWVFSQLADPDYLDSGVTLFLLGVFSFIYSSFLRKHAPKGFEWASGQRMIEIDWEVLEALFGAYEEGKFQKALLAKTLLAKRRDNLLTENSLQKFLQIIEKKEKFLSQEALGSLLSKIGNDNHHLKKISLKRFANYFYRVELADVFTMFGVSKNALDYDYIFVESFETAQKIISENRKRRFSATAMQKALVKRATPALKEHTTNLTLQLQNRLNLQELRKIGFAYYKTFLEQMNVALLTSRSNLIVQGSVASGKDMLIRIWTYFLLAGQVPEELQGLEVLELDVQDMITRLQSVEKFREQFQKLTQEANFNEDHLLYIKNVEGIFNYDRSFLLVFLDLLKTMFATSSRVVVTMTSTTFAKFEAEKTTKLGLFGEISLPSLNVGQLIFILAQEVADKRLRIEIKELELIANLFGKIQAPQVGVVDEALVFLDELAVLAERNNLEFIPPQTIQENFARKYNSGISLSTDHKVEQLSGYLESKVIGQAQVISPIIDALVRNAAGIVRDKGPVAAFLFVGPTGVGKTQLAISLAQGYFGSEKLILRLDMSEFQEQENLDRLIGDKGLLTSFINSHPYSIILFDEIEKANPKVLDLLLQLLDYGMITTTSGEKLNFKNTIVIATSNLLSAEISGIFGKSLRYNEIKRTVLSKLITKLRPELVNRFSEVLVFRPLDDIAVRSIVRKILDEEREIIKDKGMDFIYTDETVERIARKGFSQDYGAREIGRVVKEEVENVVARGIISGKLKPGDIFSL